MEREEMNEKGFVNNTLFCVYAATFYVLGMLIVNIIEFVMH